MTSHPIALKPVRAVGVIGERCSAKEALGKAGSGVHGLLLLRMGLKQYENSLSSSACARSHS